MKISEKTSKLSLSSVHGGLLFPYIHIHSSLSIPTYYLVITLTVVICLFWMVYRSKILKLSRTITLDLSLIIMVFGFIGARIFHVLYEDPKYYLEFPVKIFYFWDGGFVYYGGAILATLAGSLFLFKKVPTQFGSYLNLCAPVMSLGYLLGRSACLFAGCCYGKYCELPWAIEGRHPTQVYAMLWEFLALIILLTTERKSQRQNKMTENSGRFFLLWIILHSMGRLIMEYFRDDFRGPEWGLSVSSWISVILICGGLFLIIKKPVHSKN